VSGAAVETIDGLSIGVYDLDDSLIEATRADRRPRHRIYQPDGVQVVLGRGSRPEKELKVETCREDRVTVLRRHGGGCSVVLDPGNVIVSAVLPVAGFAGNPGHFARLTSWLISGLERIGVSGVRQRGISDLALGERKIGGACIHRSRDVLFYSVTLLVEPDTGLMERYLAHPPREPEYRQGRPHEAFVTSLAAEFPGVGGTEKLLESLGRELTLPAWFCDKLLKHRKDADHLIHPSHP